MSTVSRPLKIAGAAGLVAVAAGFGASQAMAETITPTTTPSATSSASTTGPGDVGKGPGGRHGGRGMDASALAGKLGLAEDKVATALEKVRTAQRADKPADGTKPTEAERTAREKAMVTALAKELGVTEAKVQAALEAIRAEHQAEHKTALSTRLDEAVSAGTLTAADKASVLKAFDAGVLGGGRP